MGLGGLNEIKFFLPPISDRLCLHLHKLSIKNNVDRIVIKRPK